MSNRIANKNPNNTNTNNGLAERNITGDDLKKYKSALDTSRSYVSGDNDWSSSSHQFSDKKDSRWIKVVYWTILSKAIKDSPL